MPAAPRTQVRTLHRLNFEDPVLSRFQDELVGSVVPFMRESAEGLNRLDRFVEVPAKATSTGTPGDYAASATYFYICVSSNLWRRVAIATW